MAQSFLIRYHTKQSPEGHVIWINGYIFVKYLTITGMKLLSWFQ